MRLAPAGKRIHWITLAHPDPPVPDGDGGYTQTFTPLTPAGAYASIVTATLSAQERFAAGTVITTKSSVVTLPYHAGVTTETRITVGTQVLAVVSVDNPDHRHLETVCLAVEASA